MNVYIQLTSHILRRFLGHICLFGAYPGFCGPLVEVSAIDVAEVDSEFIVSLFDDAEMVESEMHKWRRIDVSPQITIERVELGHGKCRLARVANLASVPPQALLFVIPITLEMLLREVNDGIFVEEDLATSQIESVLDEVEVQPEDIQRLVEIELRVV